MADEPLAESPNPATASGERPRWRARLYAGRWVLLAGALVFSGLVWLGRLRPTDAAVAMAIVFAATLLVPRRARIDQPVTSFTSPPAAGPDRSTRAFADALRDPCFLIDRRAHLQYANPAALRDFPGAAIGDPLAFTLRNPAFLNTVDQAVRTGRRAEGEFSISVPTETWYQVEVTPLEAPEGAPLFLTVMLFNRTEQRRLDRMRADFVANASHELRTPLTSLIGFLDTLMGPAAKDKAARERFLEIMRGQAERMAGLIDDLLSLSRIELHQHRRPTGTANLAHVVGETVELLQPQAEEAGIAIEFESDIEDPVVTGDRNELAQVFQNLIDNALKYGGDGGRVVVKLQRATERAGADVVVRVTDFGPGIAAEYVPRLTERFFRVDADASRRKKGTGLGLAIVKHIVTRHRGELSIVSELGKGTTVSVYLPL